MKQWPIVTKQYLGYTAHLMGTNYKSGSRFAQSFATKFLIVKWIIDDSTTDFVKYSYGEFRYSSCEKSSVPVQDQWVPVKKNESENWICLGLYVTWQLIWRKTPKLCITVYWN